MSDPLKAPPTKDFAALPDRPRGNTTETMVEGWPGTVEAVNMPFGPDQVAKNKYGDPLPR